MTSVFNPNLFRHTTVTSDRFNNLCTIIHPLKKEGQYTGEVFIKKQFLGSFQLTLDEKFEPTQADIDISMFDPLQIRKDKTMPPRQFEITKDGYVVIYVSGHHDGAYVRIMSSDEKGEKEVFDTRKLGKDDIVVFRPFHPGKYKLLNKSDGQETSIIIEEQKESYANPAKLAPVEIPLTVKGFTSNKSFSVSPFQAIIIKPEIDCSLTLELEKERKIKTRKSQ
jgi:hypothetical protein